jgi:hypothetical protein
MAAARSALLAVPAFGLCLSAASPPAVAEAGTGFWMRNIVMFPLNDAPATVVRLSGTAVPTRKGQIIDMNDVESYAVRVRYAQMVVPAATMQALMNQYILPSAHTAIERVSIRFGNDVIFMRGTIRKGVPIGFTAEAVAAATPDGEMRLTVTKMKTAGIIPKGVMDALGLKMSKVAQPDNRHVFRIVGDTMILPVSSMFPPPKFLGPLRSVRVTPQGMTAIVGTGTPDGPRRTSTSPFIHMRGGRIRFAHLTMAPTDLTMVAKSSTATLGFSPAHYYRQLLAGYSVSQPDFGLVGHVADYRGLAGRASLQAR